MDSRFRTVDLHTHPSMLAYMFRTKFWKEQHPTAYGFCPWAMRVNIDALRAGGVKAFLCAAYVLARTMFKDVWPLNLLSHIHPRARHMATASPDALTREYLDTAERMVEETCRRRGDVIAIDYLIQYGGEDVVAFGSDFDGFFGVLPEAITSPRGYDGLRNALLRKSSNDPFSFTRASSINWRLGVRVMVLAFWANGLLPALSQTNSPAVVPPTDAATGPTIRLDFGRGQSPGNPVASFMYFVPLISPEPVSSVTSPGSTQVARVLSAKRKSTRSSFVVTCEFEFAGNGSQQSILDLAPTIRRQERKLKAGGSIGRQLSTITVGGPGSGTVEVEGTISNNVETVSEVRLRFNAHGKTSPISIELCEIHYQEGEFRHVNEILARVNTLTFHRKADRPKMEVTVASVKNKRAGNGLWQNLKGSVMGLAVNLFIPPLTVEAVGHRAMLDFGRALSSGAETFTFPRAPHSNLNSASVQRQP